MTIFTEKELNILYSAMTKRIHSQKQVVDSIHKYKHPGEHASEVRTLNELIALQEKIDDLIWSRNKSPEIVD